MLFRSILTSALAATVVAQTTSVQIVSNIRLITQKSQALIAPAQSITIVNGPLIIVGRGPLPEIIRGFVDIVSTGTTALAQIQGKPPVPAGAQSDAIFEAFRDFVRVHQALLNILIGKSGLFQRIPFVGQAVAAVLRPIENVVDTLAFTLIGEVQSRSADIQAEVASLKVTLNFAVKKYNGIAVQKRSMRIARAQRAAVVAAAA